MRKSIKLFAFILIINIFLIACSNEDIKNPTDKDGSSSINSKEDKDAVVEDTGDYSVKDYFPFKENTLYEYKGIGDELAQQKTYMEFISKDRAQMKIFNPGMDLIKVLEYKDGAIYEVYSEGEFNHIENKIDQTSKSKSILLKEPLQVGNSWTVPGGRRRKISSLNKDLELPYGKLNAIEVTTELGEKRKQMDYYSLNLGHVASIYKDGDFEVKTLLQKIHRGSVNQSIRYFYPLEDGTGMIYKDRKISFKTNDKIESIIEDCMKNPQNETLIPLMSKTAKIKNIRMDKSNNILNIDFNKDFLSDNIKMGSFLESEIIQSIVNTLGDYYETNKVFISVEGKAYSSGHMDLKNDEYFETTDDAIKIVD